MTNAARLALSAVSLALLGCSSSGAPAEDAVATTNDALTLGDLETQSGWQTCSTQPHNCGGPGGTGTPVQTTFKPGTYGSRANAASLWVGGGVSYGTAYWYKKMADPGYVITTLDVATDFYIPAGTTYQAIEWDPQQVKDKLIYNYGWQANRVTNEWRVYNYSAHRWEPTGVPLGTLAEGTWHHFVAHHRFDGKLLHSDSFDLDGVHHVVTENGTHVPVYNADYTGADISMGLQLDQAKSGASYSVYYDNVSWTFSGGGSPPPPPTCGAPAILEPTVGQSVGPAIHLRVSAPSCIDAIKCYLDGNSTPVASAATNAVDQWVSVSVGTHAVECNGWEPSGTVHQSSTISFTRPN